MKKITMGLFSSSSAGSYTFELRFKKAVNFLVSQKVEVVNGNLIGKHHFWVSGTAKQRAEEFNQLIKNKNVNCLLSVIGGWNSNEILEYIDYDAIENNPKPIIGLSDTTALLLAIYQKTKHTVYYGQSLLTSFGEISYYSKQDWNYLSDLIVDNKKNYNLVCPNFWSDEYLDWFKNYDKKSKLLNNWVFKGVTKVTGRLIGGNLETMIHIWGTEYMPEIKKGDILFIEDTFHNAAIVDRNLAFLKLHHVFEKISGIILGKIEQYNDLKSNQKPLDIIQKFIINKNITVVANFDCSHCHPSILIPIGGNIEIDPINKMVRIISY